MAIGERYEGILKAACDVIAQRGFHQASIREIARAAGLSLAGLYHYVGGKDELLFLVLDRSLDRLLQELDVALAEARPPQRPTPPPAAPTAPPPAPSCARPRTPGRSRPRWGRFSSTASSRPRPAAPSSRPPTSGGRHDG